MKAPCFTLLFVAFGHCAQAQLCGGGSKSIVVYERSGGKLDDLKYEAFRPSKSALDSIDAGFQWSRKNERIGYCAGVTVSPAIAHRLIRAKLIQPASFKNSAAAGPLANGMVSFGTSPGGGNLLLVRIYTPGKEAFVLASFFCGCRNSIDLLWGYEPRIGYR